MKTLIIESDRSFAQEIELWLSGCSCSVDIAPNGDTALQMIDRDEYDRIVLNNICLYQHLQAQGCQSQILLLIPPGEEWQKAIAINAGIKDYLVQPFDGEELRVRWQSWSAEAVETSEDVADRIWLGVQRARAEAALQERETQLAAKLAHTQQLQRLSSQLIPENNVQSLYQQILDASIAIMEADMGTIQMLDPERNELQLLAHNGLDPASAIFWQWVGSTARSACSKALKQRDRVIIPDVEADDSLAGTDDLKAFRASGIRAAQSTPLLARDGSVVGAISTQWRSPHQPGEWELNLLEVLARQVSDLIERTRTQQQVESELRNTQLLHALATQVVTEDSAFYQEILTTAIALTAADAGTVQMLERSDGELVILAHQGFEPQMMAHFHRITASYLTSCGRALATGDRAFVDFDVPASEDADGSLKMHVEAGYLSAQSTPLVSRAGKLIGMVSTHWRQHHRPNDRQLHFLDLLARQAADAIEQRQIAAALQEREELLRSMTQAGAWSWEVVTGKLTWSPQVYRLHGIDPAREQIDYNRWFNNCLHPEDRINLLSYLEQVVKERPSEFQLEHRILHPQKGLRCLLSLAHPLWSDRGELVRMSGIIVDISDRKEAQIALQQSEAKLSQILNSAIASIVQFHLFSDGSWEYDYFSEGCELVYGYAGEELISNPHLWMSRVFPEDRQTILLPAIEQFFTGQNASLEYRFYHRDGSLRWLSSIYSSRQIESNCWEVTVVDRDITARKEAELALQQSEARFRHFAENSHVVIWIAQPASLENEYLSPAYETIWGRSIRDLSERPESWIEAVHPDDRHILQAQLEQKNLQSASTAEYRILRPDGAVRWISNLSFPIRNEAGEIYAFGGMAEDISDRKEAEIALQQSQEQLSQIMDSAIGSIARFQLYSDLSWQNDYFSKGSEGIYGYQPEEFMAEPMLWLSRVAPEDRDSLIAPALEKLAAGESVQIEYRFQHQDGSWRWLSTRYSPRPTQPNGWQVTSVTQDITARKLAEIALQQSEAQLSQIINSIIAAIVRFRIFSDGTWEYDYFSNGCEGLYSYTADEMMADRMLWISRVVPEDLETIIMPLMDEFYAERSPSIEYRFLCRDGSVRWIFCSYTSRQIEPNCWQITSVSHDITQRKLAEIALQQSEAKFRHFAQNSHAAIWIAQPNTLEALYVSPAYETIWGRSCQSAIARPESWLDSIHPEDRDRIQSNTIESRQDGSRKSEYRIVRPDGSIRWIEDWGFAIRNEDGEVYSYGGIAEDITDRKLAEIALKQSETRFSAAFNSAAIGMSLADLDGNFTQVNPAFCEITGYAEAEVVGMNFTAITHPDDIEGNRARLSQLLAGEISFYHLEKRYIHKQGRVIWVFLSRALVRDELGQPVHFIGQIQDITQRKEAERALQESQAQLSQIVNSPIVAISQFRVFSDGDWEYDYLSKGCEILYGYSAAEMMADKTLWLSRVPLEDIEAIVKPLLPRLLAEENVTSEHRFYHKNGSLLWLCTIHTSRQIAPNCWQVTAATQDTTARKLAEIALRESEARFSAAFNYAAIGMALADLEGNFTQVNSALCDLTGYAEAELIGTHFGTITHPDDLKTDLNYTQQLLAGEIGFYHLEKRYLHKGGDYIWILLSGALIRDELGQPLHFIAQIQDINDRKLAQQKIQEQAALLDVASDAIFVRDLEHRILYWNRGAERVYGWTAAEAMGRKADKLLQEDRATLKAIAQTLSEAGEWRGEIQKVAKTGAPLIVEGRWTLVQDEAGRSKYILCVNTDITEKKQLEAQFYRAQRLESVGTLASGIAHDLNNVLTPIVAMTRLLLRRSDLDEKAQEMLKLVESSAQRGTETIRQLLSFTRGTNTDGERAPVDLAALLPEVTEICQRTFSKKIAIASTIPDSANCWISANAAYLHQVLMNLCVNARDAMPNGGTISLSVARQFVDADLAKTNLDAKIGDYVLLTVTDTGTGMPPQVMQRIFDPFFTTKERGKGTGLGLAMVLRIIKDYGGFLTLSSEEGKGTEFKIYLPSIDPPPNTKSEAAEGKGKGILVVDDDIAVLRSTQALLESNSYRVFLANDGAQALKVYARHRDEIEAIVLDIMMPEMNGIELIEKIRQLDAGVNIVALSGLSANRERAIAAGANIFLAKPYSIEELLENAIAASK